MRKGLMQVFVDLKVNARVGLSLFVLLVEAGDLYVHA